MTPFLAFLIVEQVLIVIPCVLFCLHYTFAADWWSSPAGINLFGVSACLGVAFALNLTVYAWGAYAALYVITPIIFAAIAAFMWQRYILFTRAQGCNWHHAWPMLRTRAHQLTHRR